MARPCPRRGDPTHVENGRMTLEGTADVMQTLNERISLSYYP